MEKAMAPHSSTLAWQIPWTEEPGGLQSMGSLRVGHDRAAEQQPIPVFLPGKLHGQRSLVGYSTRGCKESDMTEHNTQYQVWSMAAVLCIVGCEQ